MEHGGSPTVQPLRKLAATAAADIEHAWRPAHTPSENLPQRRRPTYSIAARALPLLRNLAATAAADIEFGGPPITPPQKLGCYGGGRHRT